MTAVVEDRPTTATAADLHAVFGVKPATLRQWVKRGKVGKAGRDAYLLADVVEVIAASESQERAGG